MAQCEATNSLYPPQKFNVTKGERDENCIVKRYWPCLLSPLSQNFQGFETFERGTMHTV